MGVLIWLQFLPKLKLEFQPCKPDVGSFCNYEVMTDFQDF